MWKVSATYVLPISRQDDTLKNFEARRLHWPFCQWLIQLSKYRGFCMLALLFLVVVNLTGFHQVGAASSAPSWMKEGAYMKHELEYFASCIGGEHCTPVGNTTIHYHEYVEFVSVRESIAEIVWRFAAEPQPENAPVSAYGYLDLVTGNVTIGETTASPLNLGQSPSFNEWINPRGWQVNPETIVSWDRIATSGFPVDSGIYSEVDCWQFQKTGHHGMYRAWYDKVTGIMIENRYDDPFDPSSGTTVRDTALLYETNIPVGRQGVGLAVVETLTANSMTYATVLIAAVGAVTVVFVAFVMLRKRTPIVCGQCGRKMRRGNAFCDKCGTALASSDRPVLATPASDTR